MIQDSTGTIEVAFFNEQCSKFSQLLSENKVYQFSKFRTKVITNNNFKKGTVNFSLTAGFNSDICETEDEDIPEKKVVFSNFQSLKSDQVVNLSGIVLERSEATLVKNHHKIDITLGDTKNALLVTLWNEVAIQLGNVKKGQIISVEQTVVKNYRGNIQCSGGLTTEYNDETLNTELQDWWMQTEDKMLPYMENKVRIHLLL